MPTQRLLQCRPITDIQRDGRHAVPSLQRGRVARDGGDTVATAQGFFQQLTTGTPGCPDDCDLAHSTAPVRIDLGDLLGWQQLSCTNQRKKCDAET
ncbi:hypothetical protein D3C72_2047120 [compost metagenome]